MQTFYNDSSFQTKTIIEATAGGVLTGKSPLEVQNLMERAANNYQWINEWDNSRRQASMLKLDILNMLST